MPVRALLSAAAAVAFTAVSASIALGQPTMNPMMKMPSCSSSTGPVVWFVSSTNTYYVKGSSTYGMGDGKFVCKATAISKHAHPGTSTTGFPGAPSPRATQIRRVE